MKKLPAAVVISRLPHRGHVSGRFAGAAAAVAVALVVAGCGSSQPAAKSTPQAGHAGGTYTVLANSAFGVADPAQN